MTTTVPLISNATSSHQNHTVTPFSRLQSSPAALHPPATLANNNFSPHPSSQTVNLRHPLLRALNFYRFQHNSSALTQILAQLVVSGLLFNPFAAGRTLLALSSLPSSLPLAVTLFFVLPQPDAFAANILLRSLFTAGLPTAAFTFYRRLVLPSAVAPNHFTFPLLIKIFCFLNLPYECKTTHASIAKLGFDADVFVRNSLIHMYASLGDIVAAEKIFTFPNNIDCDTVTYNSMINGYVKNGRIPDARKVFDDIRDRDVVSWNTMITGYVSAGDMDGAKELFWMMPERDVVSWNSMIDGYARIGEVSIARELFDSMPVKNLVSWNVLLALYARVKDYRECLDLFDAMICGRNVRPNKATFVSVLTACANLGQLDRGKWIHSLIREVSIEHDVLLWTALLTMYAKCGAIKSAKEVFDQMPERGTVSWNAMIMGYGLHGQTDAALELLLEMEKCGSKPNGSTFVCILSACSQSGSVLEGWWCFDHMIRVYNIKPTVEHVGCMVDLLGRNGLLKDNADFVKDLTKKPLKALWGSLMSSCWTHSNWEIGKFVGRKLIEMMPEEVGPYILLSNIWAAEGKWEEVERVRVMMEKRGLQKGAGMSLVELDNVTDESLREDNWLGCNPKKRIVYSLLTEMGSNLKLSWKQFSASKECA
ncbi:pentatricopeptide repeat-containing protein At3g29230-like [Phalaenopsis equestris]|uniref:pentatricopeptide repeat-containing protein At3g29230-like n=1 Tax=Phalaenopsis equestris TaxID=78828 RepID=UPI0009E3F5C2|nr:pentatricopeptide repeat-containing protein At3g29230-like [Phalaenopsis equestris]